MATYKQVTFKDPKTGDYLVPRVYGTLGYQVIDGEIIPPFNPSVDVSAATGVLPIKNGGTGVSSIEELKELLGFVSVINGNIVLGNVVKVDNIDWRVVHIDRSAMEVILAKEIIEEEVKFGDNNNYVGSTIAAKCNEFKNKLSVKVRNQLISKTVYGVTNTVTNTVWIPQIDWISASEPNTSSQNSGRGLFDYFTNNQTRIALGSDGVAKVWWTSSPDSSGGGVWRVTEVGDLGNSSNYPTFTYGFRPFIALPLY